MTLLHAILKAARPSNAKYRQKITDYEKRVHLEYLGYLPLRENFWQWGQVDGARAVATDCGLLETRHFFIRRTPAGDAKLTELESPHE